MVGFVVCTNSGGWVFVEVVFHFCVLLFDSVMRRLWCREGVGGSELRWGLKG